MTSTEGRSDEGFTLVELVVALLVLAVVMAAFAPAFYGMMRASAATDQRSVADGLAVQASEEIRAIPYYLVGYSASHGNPSFCGASHPVQADETSPMDSLPTTQTVQNISYTIEPCVYWVTASDGDQQAYKEATVTVLWGTHSQYSYNQYSALYPGGEAQYSTPGAKNFTPTTLAGSATPPPAPTANSATPYTSFQGDAVSPQTIMQVDWQPVTFSSNVLYQIEYWSGQGSARPTPPSTSPVTSGAPDGSGGLEAQVSNLTPGTWWNFDVIAISGAKFSGPSNVVTNQTAPATDSSCTVTGINVTPNPPHVDSQGNPVNFTYLSVTVNATSTCTGVSVEYGVNNSQGTPQAPLTSVTLSYSSGTFSGQASQSTWSRSTYGFVVYQNGVATTKQANVTPCKQNGQSGQCT
jgi:prepilin-type N-terminal cleavage/methylation domain-containing protein